MTITIKDAQGIEGMRNACRLASEVLDYLTPFVVPGVTTNELDKLCHDYIVDVQKAIPAPLNYDPTGTNPYPKSICTSINHQVCHGIPSEKQLKKGDIVNIDITVIKDGWHGDTSRMFLVGDTSIAAILALPFSVLPKATAFRWCASFAATALASASTKSHKSCTTARWARAK
jgi:methionyl aminopeptidase